MSGEEVPARLSLFGHDPTPARARLRVRSRRWRVARALRTFAVAAVLAPVVGLIPPHAPWVIGALGIGAILARRRLRERFTLLSAEGACPRCGEPVSVEGPTRLLRPHPVGCEACRHESALRVDPEVLPSPTPPPRGGREAADARGSSDSPPFPPRP